MAKAASKPKKMPAKSKPSAKAKAAPPARKALKKAIKEAIRRGSEDDRRVSEILRRAAQEIRSGFDEDVTDAVALRPCDEGAAGEFRTVVRAHGTRIASEGCRPI